MKNSQLGDMEMRFADMIWEKEPISSGDLVPLAEEALNWKKSTTYTVLRRLIEKGLFVNTGGMVKALLSKEEFRALQSERFVEDAFSGSLPMFLTAFASRKKLSGTEIDELQRIIDEARTKEG